MPWFLKHETFRQPYAVMRPHLEAHKAWVAELRGRGVRVSSGYLVDGQGQAGNQGTWRQLDALSQLAAEAEGGSGAEQRQGAGGGDRRGVQRHLRVNVAL